MKTGTQPSGVFLLTIGDEILDGRIQNTNAAWFGEQLRLEGISVSESRSVADRLPAIARALRAGQAHSIVLVTGGLGATNDDRTLAGAARAFRLPLSPKTQLPKGAKALPNPHGTASGVHLRVQGTDFFFLPGPPTECRPMFTQHVLPMARKTLRTRRLARRELWRTFGRGESDIYQRIKGIVEALEKRYPETVAFGVHIAFPCIDITMASWRIPGKKAPRKSELDLVVDQISKSLGSFCFARVPVSLAEAVGQLLREKRLRVGTAESCTGGLLGKLLTDAPGSSDFYLGGVVAYANSAKELLLSVNKNILQEHGAVSEPAVGAMAENLRKRLKADYALAISGIAGPGGGSVDKPVGTIYVALSNRERTRTVHQILFRGKGSRDQNRLLAAHLALDALRSELLGFTESGIPVN